MKPLNLVFCGTVFLLAACNNESKTPETTADSMAATVSQTAEPYTMPDSATAMKNWMEYATPGEMQKMMASWNGDWAGEMTMWETPDAPPMTASIKTSNKMIMDGRYQESTHSGSMMDMPFEGLGTLGYDNAKKVFISTWIDNMGTGISTLSGTWNSADKSMTLIGKMVDPSAGNGREKETKEIFRILDDNTQMMEMYCNGPDGKEFKTMEIKFTRKK